jgi:hypothetical protein
MPLFTWKKASERAAVHTATAGVKRAGQASGEIPDKCIEPG